MPAAGNRAPGGSWPVRPGPGPPDLVILGAILKADSHQGGDLALGWGVAFAALWFLAGPFLRSVTAPRPPRSRDWAPHPTASAPPGEGRTSRP